jgi:uncharacterized protein (DUF952 family)
MNGRGWIYKIVSAGAWREALEAGVFNGAEVDLADGYIHFSTAAQLRDTAAKHFRGRQGLVLVVVDSARLGDALKWEPSRGGDLFPHLYVALDTAIVESVRDLALDPDGVAILPEADQR